MCRELHHHHVRLVRERRELEGKVKEWEERVQQAMTLKFGRLVDLDSLGAITANRTADELRAKLAAQQELQARELNALQVSFSSRSMVLEPELLPSPPYL